MSRHRKNDDSTDVLKVLLIIAVLAIVCSLLFGGQHYIKNRQEVNSPEENKQSKNMKIYISEIFRFFKKAKKKYD